MNLRQVPEQFYEFDRQVVAPVVGIRVVRRRGIQSETRELEQRISLITLGVADLQRAKAFYENVLGWKAAPGPPGIVFFEMNGVVFSLFPHDELAKEMNAAAGPQPPYQGWALAHNARSCAEVDRIFADLEAKGANIVKAPEQVSWGGYSGYFADPDGNRWEVAFNPYWTVTADGQVKMEPPKE